MRQVSRLSIVLQSTLGFTINTMRHKKRPRAEDDLLKSPSALGPLVQKPLEIGQQAIHQRLTAWVSGGRRFDKQR